jgi:hypothetical protein
MTAGPPPFQMNERIKIPRHKRADISKEAIKQNIPEVGDVGSTPEKERVSDT